MASTRVTRSAGEGGVIHHADCGLAGAARVDRLTLRMLHWTKKIAGRMHTVWNVCANWRTLQTIAAGFVTYQNDHLRLQEA